MKLGPVEFECTASEEFLKIELPVLIEGMAQLYKEHFADARSAETSLSNLQTQTANGKRVELTTNSIAAKMQATKGSDLVLAAALRLTRMEKAPFTRADISTQMREATSYFKQTYINNLSGYIKQLLTAGKLLESAKDSYALSDATCKELEARLAQP
jgi:hypothetical protein